MAIHYAFSAPRAVSHFALIEMAIDEIDSDSVIFRLPTWRPGRYELGNFAKNVRSFQPFNENGEQLVFRKTDKHSWQVFTEGARKIKVVYEYYCAQADAGACWIDEDLMYINPVHCCLYLDERMNEECIVEISQPYSNKMACSLQKKGHHHLVAKDFHELVDSPWFAGSDLEMRSYSVKDTTFYIWLYGNAKPDWERILTDFSAFTIEQLEMMGDFPFDEYHFLTLLLPYRFYHGVEHLKSTVLALGPGTDLMSDELYPEFIGVASHELYHTWNVKKIRPADMLPYDYSKENYSRLGYVYEGVTTYYGDLFLARCGSFSVDEFFDEISVRIQKHFDNPGRNNLSVADSSFDTWLDGYVPGVPGRKTSIYDEGSIVALMTDLIIRKNTASNYSLDDVMKTLYEDFGKKNRGYTDHDYISVISNYAGVPMEDFFLDYVYGTSDIEQLLSSLLHAAGYELVKKSSKSACERFFGFKHSVENGTTKITAVMPGSPADDAWLGKDYEIIAVNEMKVESNLQQLLLQHRGEKIVLTVITPMKKLKDIALSPSQKSFYPKYSIRRKKEVTPEEQMFFKAWVRQELVAKKEMTE